jgi:hypothetical protein
MAMMPFKQVFNAQLLQENGHIAEQIVGDKSQDRLSAVEQLLYLNVCGPKIFV